MRNALRTPAAGVVAVLVAAVLGLAACGGSSVSTTSQSNAAATSAATSTSGAPGNGTAFRAARPRISAMRECLQKNGIPVPAPSSGNGRPAGGFFGALAGGRLPKGVTRAQLQAVFKKCGGGRFGGAGGPGFRRVSSPAFRQALATYAACLRQNGVNVPPPNTTGKGPVFSTKGINTASPEFKSATAKCRSVLAAAFGARH
ncbi:MAG TPA: hypothetical protein VIC05_12515 [Solirubrobacteraceae bacterium]